MNAEDYRHLVAALFPCARVRGRCTTAVAVEHELLGEAIVLKMESLEGHGLRGWRDGRGRRFRRGWVVQGGPKLCSEFPQRQRHDCRTGQHRHEVRVA